MLIYKFLDPKASFFQRLLGDLVIRLFVLTPLETGGPFSLSLIKFNF